MTTQFHEAERLLALPRRLIPTPTRVITANWKFEIGSFVRLGDMLAVVMDRSCTAMGRQMFKIHIIGESHGRPARCVMAKGLEHVAGVPADALAN